MRNEQWAATFSGSESGKSSTVSAGEADITAPVLTNLVLPDIDVTGGPQSITFTAGATDVGTGVAYVLVNYNPSTPGSLGAESYFYIFNDFDSYADGSSSTSRTFGTGTPAGTYTITSVRVQDTSGNQTNYSTAQLAAHGIDTSFVVTSAAVADTTAPVLTSLTLPDVNVSSGPQTVIFTAGATDVGTGVAYVLVNYNPSTPGSLGAESYFYIFNDFDSYADGSSSTSRTFGSDTPAGTYTITSVRVQDTSGNQTNYSASQLAAQGIDTTFVVTSAAVADTTAPVLTSLTLPDVNVSAGPQTVTFTAGATDVGTGVAYVLVNYNPSTPGSLGAESYFYIFNDFDSYADGSSSTSRTFGSDTPAGTYTITSVRVQDASGNQTNYSTAQLAAQGIDTSFVISSDVLPNATATVTAPASLREGSDVQGSISVTIRDVSTASGTLTMSFDAVNATVSQGADVSIGSYSQSFGVSLSPARDYVFTLPAFSVFNDQFAEGQETIAIRIRLTGQTFSNGSDTVIVSIPLIDNDVRGTEQAESLEGSAFADELFGLGGDDILSGGLGRDILTGGAGVDSFRDTAAGLNGDTIADWTHGESIVISDASLTGFSAARAGNVLTFTGGSLTLASGLSGQLFVGAAPGGGVQLTVARDVRNDFNGDGRSDVVWLHNGGAFAGWLGQANGSFLHSGRAANPVDSSWRITGTGDFNGDGRDDLAWRHTSGALAEWLGQADGSFVNNNAAATTVDPSWSVAGTGDFNGDGRADLVWSHTSGAFAGWLGQADGTFLHSGKAANPVDTSWRIVGTGDFNGDGSDDLLWRHTSGTLAEWLGQADGSFVNNNAAAVAIPPSWVVLGTGDFNGDGRDDILLRNASGQLSEWLGQGNGGLVQNMGVTAAAPPDWHVAGIGDYDGDGRDDLIWRHESGGFAGWSAQPGGGFVHNANASYSIEASWVVQSPDIFLL